MGKAKGQHDLIRALGKTEIYEALVENIEAQKSIATKAFGGSTDADFFTASKMLIEANQSEKDYNQILALIRRLHKQGNRA